jgi:hypothetical protein
LVPAEQRVLPDCDDPEPEGFLHTSSKSAIANSATEAMIAWSTILTPAAATSTIQLGIFRLRPSGAVTVNAPSPR